MSSVYRRPHGEVVVLFFALLKMDSCNLSNEACNLSAMSLFAIKFCSKLLITSDILVIFDLHRRSCCCKFLIFYFNCLLDISVLLLPILKSFS